MSMNLPPEKDRRDLMCPPSEWEGKLCLFTVEKTLASLRGGKRTLKEQAKEPSLLLCLVIYICLS